MPTHDFECLKCGKVHEVFRHFSDKLPEKISELDLQEPCCHGNCKVRQIIGVPDISVRASASEVSTVGQLAERNAKKLGKELMQKRDEDYKTKKANTLKLNEGMSLSKKTKTDKKKVELLKTINKMTDKQKQRYIKGE